MGCEQSKASGDRPAVKSKPKPKPQPKPKSRTEPQPEPEHQPSYENNIVDPTKRNWDKFALDQQIKKIDQKMNNKEISKKEGMKKILEIRADILGINDWIFDWCKIAIKDSIRKFNNYEGTSFKYTAETVFSDSYLVDIDELQNFFDLYTKHVLSKERDTTVEYTYKCSMFYSNLNLFRGNTETIKIHIRCIKKNKYYAPPPSYKDVDVKKDQDTYEYSYYSS